MTNLKFDDGSQAILDIYNDTVVAVQRNFFRPDKLVIGKLPGVGSETSLTWTDLTSSEVIPGLENCVYKYLDLTSESAEDSASKYYLRVLL